jgi:hypothetical protein
MIQPLRGFGRDRSSCCDRRSSILTPKDIEIGGPIDRRLAHDWPADMPLVASFEKICAGGMGVVYRVHDERLVPDVTSGRCRGSAQVIS